MIEPFDAERHDALIENHPIKILDGDQLTHRLDDEQRKAVCAFDGYPLATRATTDWRLVNCPDCRRVAQPAGG